MEELEVYVAANTKYYDTVDSKRRKDIFTKITEGWISSEDIENPRILFHYPLLLSEGQKSKSVYVNKEDIVVKVVDKLGVTLNADTEERLNDMYYECHMTDEQLKEFEKSKPAEEIELCHTDINKNSNPVFEDCYKIVKLKPGVCYDFDGKRVGNLINKYYLLSENNGLFVLENISSNTKYRILKSNVIGY